LEYAALNEATLYLPFMEKINSLLAGDVHGSTSEFRVGTCGKEGL
jgi:hypothetical protein